LFKKPHSLTLGTTASPSVEITGGKRQGGKVAWGKVKGLKVKRMSPWPNGL